MQTCNILFIKLKETECIGRIKVIQVWHDIRRSLRSDKFQRMEHRLKWHWMHLLGLCQRTGIRPRKSNKLTTAIYCQGWWMSTFDENLTMTFWFPHASWKQNKSSLSGKGTSKIKPKTEESASYYYACDKVRKFAVCKLGILSSISFCFRLSKVLLVKTA